MVEQFKYQSDEFDRNAQRHIIPLYIRDSLGNYVYSSTGTLAKHQDHHYVLFAAHALDGGTSIDQLYAFMKDGTFYNLAENSVAHKVFKNEDIGIFDLFNIAFDGKNYFDLHETSLIGLDKKHFYWIGFPGSKSKSKQIHRSKTPEALVQQYVQEQEDGSYFTNTKYFAIHSKLITNNNMEMTGKYDRENTNLKYAGRVSMAPHPSGMSGGAMYFSTKAQKLQSRVIDTFRFAGIGVKYKKDNTIVGVPRTKIIELLNLFKKEQPMTYQIIGQQP
ncbi:hypothetical protein [Pseudomonas syringae]|uniref:hypothetical protein n=1 Tax=Pseudomonas TaxID=286 RepID=UPI00076017C7|nr:hypothetical protein [Pseudomonas syringae]KWS20186.1 hypothetical protein AL062_21405 [Pseudomonas syringae pv. syringae]